MRLTESELRQWGRRLGETIEAPVVLGLTGTLGAGKSVLARAIGEGAGVSDPMPSPTFTLLQRYAAGSGREVVHLDLYRLTAPEERKVGSAYIADFMRRYVTGDVSLDGIWTGARKAPGSGPARAG